MILHCCLWGSSKNILNNKNIHVHMRSKFWSRLLPNFCNPVSQGSDSPWRLGSLYMSSPGRIARCPNPAEPTCPPESGRTQIGNGRPNPAEIRFGTAVRIRPNSDWGRPPESGRKTYFLIVNCVKWFIRLPNPKIKPTNLEIELKDK